MKKECRIPSDPMDEICPNTILNRKGTIISDAINKEIKISYNMCGIAGIVRFDKKPVNKDEVLKMMRVIKHRGPDDEGE